MATVTPKRKRTVLSLEVKHDIIHLLEEGIKPMTVAKLYDVGRSTISDIKKDRDRILAFMASQIQNGGVAGRKTMRKAGNEHMEKLLFKWYRRETSRGVKVSGKELSEKAQILHRQLNGEQAPPFKATSGWLHKFKQRHGIIKDDPDVVETKTIFRAPLIVKCKRVSDVDRRVKGIPLRDNNIVYDAALEKCLPDRQIRVKQEEEEEDGEGDGVEQRGKVEATGLSSRLPGGVEFHEAVTDTKVTEGDHLAAELDQEDDDGSDMEDEILTEESASGMGGGGGTWSIVQMKAGSEPANDEHMTGSGLSSVGETYTPWKTEVKNENGEEECSAPCTSQEALYHVKRLEAWLQSVTDSDPLDIIFLRHLREKVEQIRQLEQCSVKSENEN